MANVKDIDLSKLNEEGVCPTCGYDRFLEGPHGGMAVNIRCDGCGDMFWYAPPFSPRRIDNPGPHYREPPRTLKEMFHA